MSDAITHSDLERSLKPIHNAIAVLVTEMSEVRTEMSDARVERSDMRAKMTDMRRDIRDMRGDITEMRGDIREIRGDITGLRTDMKDLRNTMMERFDHLISLHEGTRQEQLFTGAQIDRHTRQLDRHDQLFKTMGLDPTPVGNGD